MKTTKIFILALSLFSFSMASENPLPQGIYHCSNARSYDFILSEKAPYRIVAFCEKGTLQKDSYTVGQENSEDVLDCMAQKTEAKIDCKIEFYKNNKVLKGKTLNEVIANIKHGVNSEVERIASYVDVKKEKLMSFEKIMRKKKRVVLGLLQKPYRSAKARAKNRRKISKKNAELKELTKLQINTLYNMVREAFHGKDKKGLVKKDNHFRFLSFRNWKKLAVLTNDLETIDKKKGYESIYTSQIIIPNNKEPKKGLFETFSWPYFGKTAYERRDLNLNEIILDRPVDFEVAKDRTMTLIAQYEDGLLKLGRESENYVTCGQLDEIMLTNYLFCTYDVQETSVLGKIYVERALMIYVRDIKE